MSDHPYRRLLIGLAAALSVAVAVPTTASAEPTTPTVPPKPAPPSASFPTDDRGYSGTGARCDAGQTLVEFGRTARALVAICIGSNGDLEYRGVRLSDQAALTMPATRAADGTVTAVNEGVTYVVTPKLITVSEGDNVLYRDAWTEFREPRFSAGPPSTTAATSTTSTPTAATTTATTPPTVSTTTVSTTTVTPTSSNAR